MGKFKVGDRVCMWDGGGSLVATLDRHIPSGETFAGQWMATCVDGSPAIFHEHQIEIIGGNDEQFDQSPTLLDQFAMAALTGLLSDSNVKPDVEGTEADFMSDVAECAYRHAQAMMKAREVQK